MRTKDGESEATRLGCKYADRMWAGLLGITEEDAQLVYKCSHSYRLENEGIPHCPLDFLPECILDIGTSDADRWSFITRELEHYKTCKLIPIEYKENQPAHECSECKSIIRGDTYFMKYCYRCGARRVGG